MKINLYFTRLIVKKEYRKQGIGTQLVKYASDYVKELGYKEISVGVDLDNYNAIKLYVKLVFTKILYIGEDEMGKYFKLLKKL